MSTLLSTQAGAEMILKARWMKAALATTTKLRARELEVEVDEHGLPVLVRVSSNSVRAMVAWVDAGLNMKANPLPPFSVRVVRREPAKK
jgi:hypothetical protein